MRPNGNRTVSNATTASAVAARSKGMQMVSDMRSRVKTLEQRIQSRVPRIRKPSMRLGDLDGARRGSGERDRSTTESPGWVLITQEASPTKLQKDSGAWSPPPSSFRPAVSTSTLKPPAGSSNSLSASQMPLLASTNSRSISRTGRPNSSVAQHGPRSVTPTHLSIPTEASKQPARRSSLSASLHPPMSSRTRPPSTNMPSRPPLPSMHTPPPAVPTPLPAGRGSQLPTRSGSSLGMSTRNALSMSKIGRPSSLTGPPRSGPRAEE
ncbi:hypothetical protein BS47DRAFT_242553 [Hydnum rufescens UP504]|uniref:Uncharacterized protein n=1 Tax=Hydnum rufescens UP504 TaxID=1448309 RepID=A0A9P6ALY6_9AGAM|nr:hypothetical protein BS47DRAFT_242553 [Hydnum rufescens UP504]